MIAYSAEINFRRQFFIGHIFSVKSYETEMIIKSSEIDGFHHVY